MKRIAARYRLVPGGSVGSGCYAFYSTIFSLWLATGPLIHSDLRQEYFLLAGAWCAVLLVCCGAAFCY